MPGEGTPARRRSSVVSQAGSAKSGEADAVRQCSGLLLTVTRVIQILVGFTFLVAGIVCQLWAASNISNIPLSTLCETYSGVPEAMDMDDFNHLFDWVESSLPKSCSNRACLSYSTAAGFFLSSNEKALLSGQVDRMRYASEVFYCKFAPSQVLANNATCSRSGIKGPCQLWPGQHVSKSSNWFLPAAAASYDGPIYSVSCADKVQVFKSFLQALLVRWTDDELAAAVLKFAVACEADKEGDSYMLAVGPAIAIIGCVITLMTLVKRLAGPSIAELGLQLLQLSIILLLVGFWAVTIESTNNIVGKYQLCSNLGAPLAYNGKWYDGTPCLDADTNGDNFLNPFAVATLSFHSTYIAGGVLTLLAVLLFIGLRVELGEDRMKESFEEYTMKLQEAGAPEDGQYQSTGASFWEPNDEGEDRAAAEFTPSKGLSTAQAEELLMEWGRNELVEKVTPTWLVILRLLTGPMPIMLWIAAAIEGAIENFADMGILLGIQFVNAGISFYETTKAGNAVAALKASLKPLATVKRDGKWLNMDAGAVVPGDLVLLAAGSAVPADCYVNEGEIEVDQSAMTGESLPVKFRKGDVCKMGSTVTRGETEGTVETTGQNTFFGKTAAMLSSVDNSGGSLQTLLLQVMTVLVALSLSLCTIAFIFLVIAGQADNAAQLEIHQKSKDEILKEALSFAVVVLVASIPLAVEIVTTTTLAMGSRSLSSHGAIVTRLASIEELAGMDMLCSDKTGTLTLNKMVIQDDCPVYSAGETKETIMFQAALAAKWKEPPRDALDTMVLKTGLQLPQADEQNPSPTGVKNREALDRYSQLDFLPFDPRTKRTEGKLKGPDGNIFRITKGAPHVILNLSANKDEIMHEVESKVHELGTRGIRSLAVARAEGEDGPWRFLGILTFLDPPRPDTKQTIADANAFGVEVKMITGDHKTIAVETARMLGMGTLIQGPQGLPMLEEGGKVPDKLPEYYGALIVPSCGFAQVFPEHKFLIVECLRQVGFRCGMTGDGVNDAPALKRADVGIAVAGSTDAARAAADIVLTGEGLSVCIVAIKIAREIFSRLKNFVTYRISATLQLLFFFFIAVFALPPRDYYIKNGINGVDMVSNNPLYGGNPAITTYDSVYTFNLPRRSWACPGGLLDGANDPRLAPYMDLVTQKTYTMVESTSLSSGIPEVKPAVTARSTVRYFKINAMNPGSPGIDGYNAGCDITIPICHATTTCLDAESGGYARCPEFQVCNAWPFFFQLPVLMLMLITLLNDGALISIGYDNVTASPTPERWNIRLIFAVSIVLGAVACGSSLLLLWAALDSNNPDGAFAALGLPPMEYGKIVTMIYLKVSLSDFLTLFSARTQDRLCFLGPPPNPILFSAAAISLVISTFLASFWPPGLLDGLPVMGLALGQYTLMPLWIWIYCLLWWIVQDILKVLTIHYFADHPLFRTPRVDRRQYEVLNAAVPKEGDKKPQPPPPPAHGDAHAKANHANGTAEAAPVALAAKAAPPQAAKPVPAQVAQPLPPQAAQAAPAVVAKPSTAPTQAQATAKATPPPVTKAAPAPAPAKAALPTPPAKGAAPGAAVVGKPGAKAAIEDEDDESSEEEEEEEEEEEDESEDEDDSEDEEEEEEAVPTKAAPAKADQAKRAADQSAKVEANSKANKAAEVTAANKAAEVKTKPQAEAKAAATKAIPAKQSNGSTPHRTDEPAAVAAAATPQAADPRPPASPAAAGGPVGGAGKKKASAAANGQKDNVKGDKSRQPAPSNGKS